MHLSTAEAILYLCLGAGVFLALHYGISQWVAIAGALALGLVATWLVHRYERSRPARSGEPAEAALPVAPWRRRTVWVAPALLAVLGVGLAWVGTPTAAIAAICGIGAALLLFDFARQYAFFRRLQSDRPLPGASLESWTALAISVAFCVIALLLWRNDWRTALVTLAVFGGGVLVFIEIIVRKRRERRFAANVVRIAGGVNIPIRPARIHAIGLGMIVVGAVMWFVGTQYPLMFRLIGAFIALVGAAVLVMSLAGLMAGQFIRFDPAGIVVGQRSYHFHIPWDEIAEIVQFEHADNSFVALRLFDPGKIPIDPPGQAHRFAKLVRNNVRSFGVDVLIAPRNFGLDARPLVAALVRYREDPQARLELTPAPALSAPRSADAG